MSARAAVAIACAGALASGCAGQLPTLSEVSPSGPCVQKTVTGGGKHRHIHYWKNGVEIDTNGGGLDGLETALGDFAPTRRGLRAAAATSHASWALLGLGLASYLAGLIAFNTAGPPLSPGPGRDVWWPGLAVGLGGEAAGAIAFIALRAVSDHFVGDALERYNEHAAQVGCR